MPTLSPTFPTDALIVRPWPDQVIETLGHDPRSPYVERFWLGILGPSTTWLLRRLAAGLDARPAGYRLDLRATARELGLSDRGGRGSPFVRALARCCQFDLAQLQGDDVLAVRRKVPPLTRRQVERLPDSLRDAHRAWEEALARTPMVDQLRRRARHLARTLLDLGEDPEAVERQLMRWQFHPSLSREAAVWAADQLRAGGGRPPHDDRAS